MFSTPMEVFDVSLLDWEERLCTEVPLDKMLLGKALEKRYTSCEWKVLL